MRERNVKPTQQLYTLIFDAVSKVGDLKGSLDILSRMYLTFAITVHAFIYLQTNAEMNKDGIKPSVTLWTSLMRSTSRAIQYDRGMSWCCVRTMH